MRGLSNDEAYLMRLMVTRGNGSVEMEPYMGPCLERLHARGLITKQIVYDKHPKFEETWRCEATEMGRAVYAASMGVVMALGGAAG